MLPEESEPDALAYLGFPREHARWAKANDVQERASVEVKRRTGAVQMFPSVGSIVQLVEKANDRRGRAA